jgi:hypothetical protein
MNKGEILGEMCREKSSGSAKGCFDGKRVMGKTVRLRRKEGKVNISLLQAMEAHRVARG